MKPVWFNRFLYRLFLLRVIVLLQRVLEASVSINDETVAVINRGLLLLVGIEKKDNEDIIQRMSERVLAYRVFADSADKMNNSVVDVSGEILVVPQFTLAANTKKGLRPNFSSAAAPEHAKKLFDCFLNTLNSNYAKIESGKFAADMQVHLINDGPVTFWLEI